MLVGHVGGISLISAKISEMDLLAGAAAQRTFFESGATQSYAFRVTQLRKLRDAILRHEEALFDALAADLKKGREESWVTETGMVLSELRVALRKLRRWMKPHRVGTNLVNLPSSSRIYAEPLGVVFIIAPWNYPVQLLLNPLIGAIAAGNCVTLKPSDHAPATEKVLQQLITETFPPDYISVVTGEGHEVVPALMNRFRFDHVFFTGSTAVGREVYKMAADKLVPVTLELGGKSPCIVEADASLKVAARRIAIARFSNAGQMCVAPDYLLVQAAVYDRFLALLRDTIHQFFSDNPQESDEFGKIINTRQFDRLATYLQQGEVYCGGRANRERLYIEPTILTGVNPDASVMQDEIFGPVLPVFPFTTKEEALSLIRRHPDPLAFYVYTSSRQREQDWLQAVPAGGVCVNNSAWHLTNHNLPFGGRGNSGLGRYHGRFSFETFSHLKAVMKTPAWFDPDLKYPPLRGKLSLFKKVIR
jgi:aldehyde dehydrogenase (NAD+)